jgi:cysteine desulfurase
MHGNPEIGTLQPVAEAAGLTAEAGSLFHTDASTTAGILPGLWKQSPLQLMTVSPHLFHGPKGIAALVVREGTRMKPQEEGGTQEGGLRAGTESVALAAGFGVAARLAREASPVRALRLTRLAEALRRRLEASLAEWIPTGDAFERIPGHLSVCVRYVEGEAVLGLLDEEGILAGSGSPCTREVRKESHVLKAIGIDPVLGRGSLQFSFGAFSRDEEVELVARILPPIVDRLRRISPLIPRS